VANVGLSLSLRQVSVAEAKAQLSSLFDAIRIGPL
jgi:hypothetical protein